ncbi:MAG: hypothetical protein HUU37_05985 [Bdellovibrionales bacterium]|nr:hypothetical protein [Bdellovibrionales bacterium]
MKYFLMAMVALVGFDVSANRPVPVLDKAEQKTVLRAIDNMCSDTWCEGEYGFDFKSFDCTAAVDGTSCVLDFVIIDTEYVKMPKNSRSEARVRRQYPVSCEVGPFTKKSDLYAVRGERGEYTDVPQPLLDALNECIFALEDHLFTRR